MDKNNNLRRQHIVIEIHGAMELFNNSTLSHSIYLIIIYLVFHFRAIILVNVAFTMLKEINNIFHSFEY